MYIYISVGYLLKGEEKDQVEIMKCFIYNQNMNEQVKVSSKIILTTH